MATERRRIALAAGFLWATVAGAHDPITTKLTWSREISRVVYQHCAGCHHPGGRAMSLITYEDARPWAKAIRDEVLNRRMPPWDAVKGVGQFREDPSLSLPVMDLLVNWVEGGAPEGDPAFLPNVPHATEDAPKLAGSGTEVRESLTLQAPATLRGITPSGSTEVVAALPDGEVKRLLWVRDFHAEWNRTYELRTPLRLPRGSRLLVYGAAVKVNLLR